MLHPLAFRANPAAWVAVQQPIGPSMKISLILATACTVLAFVACGKTEDAKPAAEAPAAAAPVAANPVPPPAATVADSTTPSAADAVAAALAAAAKAK